MVKDNEFNLLHGFQSPKRNFNNRKSYELFSPTRSYITKSRPPLKNRTSFSKSYSRSPNAECKLIINTINKNAFRPFSKRNNRKLRSNSTTSSMDSECCNQSVRNLISPIKSSEDKENLFSPPKQEIYETPKRGKSFSPDFLSPRNRSVIQKKQELQRNIILEGLKEDTCSEGKTSESYPSRKRLFQPTQDLCRFREVIEKNKADKFAMEIQFSQLGKVVKAVGKIYKLSFYASSEKSVHVRVKACANSKPHNFQHLCAYVLKVCFRVLLTEKRQMF